MTWKPDPVAGWSAVRERITTIIRHTLSTVVYVVAGGALKSGKEEPQDTTAGFWLGVDDDGVAQFHVGDAASALRFDGTSTAFSGDGSGVTNIDGGHIQAGTITADKIAVDQLDALAVNTGALNVDQEVVVGTSGGAVRSGKSGYETGVGWWLGIDDADGLAKLDLGDPAGHYLRWNGAGVEARFSGVDISPLPGGNISDGSILRPKIAAGAIGSDQLDALAVTAAKIALGAVGASQLADLAVTAGKIAPAAVTAGKIGAGAVGAFELASGAVQEAKLASLAVSAAKLQSGAVEESKLAAGAVTEAKLAAGAVTTAKIADAQVTAGKISVSTLADIASNMGVLTANAGITFGASGAVQSSDGDAVMDDSGFAVATGTSSTNKFKVKSGSAVVGQLYADIDAGVGTSMFLTAIGEDSGDPEGSLELAAATYDGSAHGGRASTALTLDTESGVIDVAADRMRLNSCYLELTEQSDPAAPAANRARLFVRDNGSGKTQLCVRFPTGSVQVLATEP